MIIALEVEQLDGRPKLASPRLKSRHLADGNQTVTKPTLSIYLKSRSLSPGASRPTSTIKCCPLKPASVGEREGKYQTAGSFGNRNSMLPQGVT